MPPEGGPPQKQVIKSWDPWKMFDATPEEIALAAKRKEIKLAKSKEYRKLVENPTRLGKGGHIVDGGEQRWYSAKMASANFFKSTPRSIGWLFGCYLIPIFVITVGSWNTLQRRERMCRSNEWPIGDRAIRRYWRH